MYHYDDESFEGAELDYIKWNRHASTCYVSNARPFPYVVNGEVYTSELLGEGSTMEQSEIDLLGKLGCM